MYSQAMMSDLYGNFRNRKFCQIFPDIETFLIEYNNSKLTSVDEPTITTIYYLLYARYGNSTIASSDENQFKYNVWSTIFMYGPTWAKRLDIQKKLRELSDAEIIKGSTAIHNHAYNPSDPPSTGIRNFIGGINDQTVSVYDKSAIEGYQYLASLLETDVTEPFIGKFKKLFLTIVAPELPLWYVSEDISSTEEN